MSSQKRKRDVARKGFKATEDKTRTPEVLAYDDDSDTAEEMNPKATKVAKSTTKKSNSSRDASVKKVKTPTNADDAQSRNEVPEIDHLVHTARFHYPHTEISMVDIVESVKSKNHRAKLLAALETISSAEIESLQDYFQNLSKSELKGLKVDVLSSLKSVLSETVDEVRANCPGDVEFCPEYKEAEERGEADSLEALRDRLQQQASELDQALENLEQFGGKYDVSLTSEAVKLRQGDSSGRSPSRKKKSDIDESNKVAITQLASIVKTINDECDNIIDNYIGKDVKTTLDFVEQSQSGLYDTYEKVRNSKAGASLPKSKILSPSRRSGTRSTSKGMEVHEYVNLLQSQAGNQPAFTGNKASDNSSSSSDSSAKGGSKTQDSKKLLRGFGKT